MEIKIRTAQPEDAEKISEFIQELWRDVLSESYNDEVVKLFLNFNTQERIRKSIEHPQRICWVAEVDGVIAGFLEARIIEGEIERDRLMVKKEMRRKGIGTALVEELKKMGAPMIVDAADHPATIEFYKKAGFKVVEKAIRTINGVDVKVVVMKYAP